MTDIIKRIKPTTRALRLWWYHLRTGPGFNYHGLTIDLPDSVPFTFKRQLMRGVYEEAERFLIDKYLEPDLPVIECGGSLGVISAYIGSKLAQDTPHTIIEANPNVLQICKKNAALMKRRREPEIIHAAIGYGSETIRFSVSDNIHISHVGASGERVIEVPTTTVADQIGRLGNPKRFTVVMDIEGLELESLKRERDAFANCALAIIEFHPAFFAKQKATPEDFFDAARDAGLELLEVRENTAAFRSGTT